MQHSELRIPKTGKRLECGSTSDILGSSLGQYSIIFPKWDMGCPTFENQTERAIMASVNVSHTPEPHGSVGSVHVVAKSMFLLAMVSSFLISSH